MDPKIVEYMSQLTPLELKAHNIAQQHLKSSFNIVKSNGYLEWLKKQPKTGV
jgi:hypothetical protein